MFIGSIVAEAAAPVLCPPDAKGQLIGKDSDAGNDWEQEEKWAAEDEMRWLDSITDSMDMNVSKPWEVVVGRVAWQLQSMGLQSRTRLSDWTELNW